MSDKLFMVTIKVLGMIEIPTYNVEIEEIFRSKHYGAEKEDFSAFPCPHCQEFVDVHVKLIPDEIPKLEPIIVEILEIKKEDQESDSFQDPPTSPSPSIKSSPFRRLTRNRPKPNTPKPLPKTPPKPLPKTPPKAPPALQQKPASEYGNQSLLCAHCGRSYTKKTTLEKHIQIHHRLAENRRVCPQCGVKVLYTQLNKHIKSVHDPPRLECDLCPDRRRFKCKWQIAKHMRNTHRSERPVMCVVEGCGKLFRHGYERKAHMETRHDPDRQRLFPCNRCPKTFYTKYQLKTHIDHHEGVRRYSCPEPGCDKTFIGKNNLTTHMLVHYPIPRFVCKECGKRYSRKTALLVHERIHSGVRDYVCTYPGCTSRFYDDGTLRQHKLFHVKRDKGLVNMRLPDVAKLHHRQGKFYWEEGYPKSDEKRN